MLLSGLEELLNTSLDAEISNSASHRIALVLDVMFELGYVQVG